MNEFYILWFIMGTFQLCFMTYQDLKHNKKIDDRHNYIMYGATIMLLVAFPHKWYVFLSALIIVRMWGYLAYKLTGLGIGDINALTWILTGFSLAYFWLSIIFLCLLSGLLIFYLMLIRVYFGKVNFVPAFPVILLSYFLTGLIYGLI